MIVYEYPFNERIRTYLRLEHLFLRLVTLIGRDTPLDHHHALQAVFDIMDVAARGDMKADVLKDLEKQKQQLASYRGKPGVSEAALSEVLAEVESRFTALNELPGKVAQALADNDILMAVRSRMSIPGGTCEFDLPAYHDWLHHPAAERQADLQRWTACLSSLSDGVQLLLRLLRDTGVTQKVVAPGGQFQQNLPQGRTFHLLRLAVPAAAHLVPEISGNRLMFSIRLQRRGEDDRLAPVTEDVGFELTLCS